MLHLPSCKDPVVSIIIVTTRGAQRLLRCLTAVSRHASVDLPVEVIVVLNAAESEVRSASERARGLRTVDSKISLGFAGGMNLGVRAARGQYVHALHDDTEVTEGWLTALVDLISARPEVGAVGSMLLEPSGDVQTAGVILWADGRVSVPWHGEPPPPRGAFKDAVPVDYASSASLLVRRDLWHAIGGMDEQFHPAYYIDVDLAMALRRAGWSVWCEPRSQVVHQRGGSAGLRFRIFVSERNRARFVAKWSSELQDYEPHGTSTEALERALAGTRRRAAVLRAADRWPVRPVVALEETEFGRVRREHLQLRRDLAVKNAYVAELEALVTAHKARRAAADSCEPPSSDRSRVSWLRRGSRRALALANRARVISRRASSNRTE